MWKKGLLVLIVGIGVCLGFQVLGEKKSNQPLKVIVIFHEDVGKFLLETFKEKADQPYDIIRMSSGEASYNLLTLGKTGIDVVLGGPADLHEQLKNKSKSLRYSSASAGSIPSKYKDAKGYWTGMYMGALAIGVNQTVWQQDPQLAALPLPQQYEDLLRPELKGKIEIPDPETSGTGYTLLASVAQQRGDRAAIDLMQALKKQSASMTFAGNTSAQHLAEGGLAAAVSFLSDQLRFKNSGYNISSFIPPQAGWEIGAISILKGGNNPAAAKQLVDFMLSKETQTDYMNTAFSFPLVPNILVNPLLAPVKLENLLAAYRFDLAAQQHEKLLNQWREALE
ncbi:hypothetical protein ASG89_29375 [Paenibacillus sp. Soil766]|uniref:extracellular solute-binding protein n=1 Tax=Paenibacillus sp. Soil766 TaxID=1736404 RepID=UPI000708D752|nr:extracellular solute-binding protein [Paenibacillus sp. Soil766]KRE97718.1 hypothetical protein ASG89_29375 [Paenibacillus sp. Soil766]